MSLGPNTNPTFDLFSGNGTGTGTQAGPIYTFAPGKKAVQVSLSTSATCTVKIQNSIDGTNWFDVSSSTQSAAGVGGSYLAEIDSCVPKWRVNVTAFTTAGTGNVIVAQMAGSVAGL